MNVMNKTWTILLNMITDSFRSGKIALHHQHDHPYPHYPPQPWQTLINHYKRTKQKQHACPLSQIPLSLTTNKLFTLEAFLFLGCFFISLSFSKQSYT